MQSLLRTSVAARRLPRRILCSNGELFPKRGRCLSSTSSLASPTHEDDDDDDPDERRRWMKEAERMLSRQGEQEIMDEPWKAVLAVPARASWRAAEVQRENPHELAVANVLKESSHPVNAKNTRQTMDATIKKLRRLAHKRHVQRKNANAGSGRDFFRDKRTDGKQDRGQIKPGEESKAIIYGPLETVANIKYRSKPNFYIARRVLEEAQSLIGRTGDRKFQPQRILDFGMGCGSASAAALQVFGDDSPIEWIHGVDASQVMREGGESLLKEFIRETNEAKDKRRRSYDADDMTNMPPPPPLWSPRITTSAHLSSDPYMSAENLNATMIRAAFDLCLFSYTATEIPKSGATLAAAALLWEKLKPGGLLVVIEPGTPDGFSAIRGIRNVLLDCCPPNSSVFGAEECHVIAPCTHNGPCPLGLFAQSNKETLKEDENEEAEDEEDSQSLANMVAEEEDDRDFDFGNDDGEGEEEAIPLEEQTIPEEDEKGSINKEYPVERGYCSFVQTFPNRGHEKFSYLVLQKQLAGMHPFNKEGESELDKIDVSEMLSKHLKIPPTDPLFDELTTEASDLARKYLRGDDSDDLGLQLIRSQKSSFGRIVRPPKKRGKHVILDSCTDEGMSRQVLSKAFSKSAPGLYQAARKTRWGGFWLKAARKPENEEEVQIEYSDS